MDRTTGEKKVLDKLSPWGQKDHSDGETDKWTNRQKDKET
jgi:hypothetical protein